MRVGFDLDGTITDASELFAVITAALLAGGHEVHVITYRDADTREETERELKSLKISYTSLHLPGDNEDMAPWKAAVADRLGLDAMFEDSPEVLATLPARVKRLWICDPEIIDLKACIEGMRKRL